MNSEVKKEIEDGYDSLEHLTKFPPKNILVHVYRARENELGEWKADTEGRMVGKAVAAFLNSALENHTENNWTKPNILMGAGLEDAFGGNPLYKVYSREICDSLRDYHIDTSICTIIEPHEIYQNPHGTKTELEAFQYFISTNTGEGDIVPLVIARAPHMKRIKQLSQNIGLEANYLCVESIILKLVINGWSAQNSQFEETFKDFFRFSTAESIKLLFMSIFDKSGDGLENFSKNHPIIKDILLTLLGHKSK